MNYIFYFLAGFFLFNAIPHLVKGITGQTHMTPFRRVSSPKLNIIWAFVNLILGSLMLGFASQGSLLVAPWESNLRDLNLDLFILGGLVISFMDANLFGNPSARLPWHKD